MIVFTPFLDATRPLAQAGVTVPFEDIKDFTGVLTVTVTAVAYSSDAPVDIRLEPANYCDLTDWQLVADRTLAAGAGPVPPDRAVYRFAFTRGAPSPSAEPQADGDVLLLVLSLGRTGGLARVAGGGVVGDPPPLGPVANAHASVTYTLTFTNVEATAALAAPVAVTAMDLPVGQTAATQPLVLPAPAGSGYIFLLPETVASRVERTDLTPHGQPVFVLSPSVNENAFSNAGLLVGHGLPAVSGTKDHRRTPRLFLAAVNDGKCDGNVTPLDGAGAGTVEVATATVLRPTPGDGLPEFPLAAWAALTYRSGFVSL